MKCHSCRLSEAKWKVSTPGFSGKMDWLCDTCKSLQVLLFGGIVKEIKYKKPKIADLTD